MTKGENVMKKLMTAMFAAATALSASAYAGPTAKIVSYADLDLSRTAGAEVLLRRVEGASESVCGGTPSIRDLAMTAAFRRCVRENIDEAVATIDAPLLTSIHERTHGFVNIARK
jgi:UrcA family protein